MVQIMTFYTRTKVNIHYVCELNSKETGVTTGGEGGGYMLTSILSAFYAP